MSIYNAGQVRAEANEGARPSGVGETARRPVSATAGQARPSAGRRLAKLVALAAILLLGLSLTAGPARARVVRVIETEHYRVHSDLDDELTADLTRRLEMLFAEYSRRLADFTIPQDAPRFEVYLFERRLDYMKLTGDRFPNTGGVFMSGRSLLAGFLEGQGRDGLRRTLQHEAFHQFAYQAISPKLPVWLNEGLAQIFEEGIWTGRQFYIGEIPPRRLRQLQADMAVGRMASFETFIGQTNDGWAATLRDRESAAAQYNQAWAMVHFLTFATDENGRPKYRERLVRWMRDIHNNADPADAFAKEFGTNIDGFQQRFTEWAQAAQATPLSSIIERQETLADLVSLLDARGKSFASVAELRKQLARGKYRLHYTRGPLEWSSDDDALTYLRDLNGNDFSAAALFFTTRHGAPLADIICRPLDGLQLHTRFFGSGKQIQREVVVEAIEPDDHN